MKGEEKVIAERGKGNMCKNESGSGYVSLRNWKKSATEEDRE